MPVLVRAAWEKGAPVLADSGLDLEQAKAQDSESGLMRVPAKARAGHTAVFSVLPVNLQFQNFSLFVSPFL